MANPDVVFYIRQAMAGETTNRFTQILLAPRKETWRPPCRTLTKAEQRADGAAKASAAMATASGHIKACCERI